MNPLEFMANKDLMGEAFTGDTRNAMKAVISGAWALPMKAERLSLFKELSGGREPPSQRVRELWMIIGRRAEKSKTAAALAIYLATVGAELDDLKAKLSAGEYGVISLIAVDRKQAQILMSYVVGLMEESAVLSSMIERQDSETIVLNNRTKIEIHTNSFRAVRGRTLLAVILDECSFFRADYSANPDIETYRAALPGLATTGGLMIGISSPYSRKGLLYQKYKRHYGQNDDILVIKGTSRIFNPTLPIELIEQAIKDDPEAARSEWLGEFRDDLAAFISREVVERQVRPSPLELPYDRKHSYRAFTDPAGGGQDEFTLCISHKEKEIIVIDLVRGLKGTPSVIVSEYAQIIKSYKLSSVTGDRYGGSWPADEFGKNGISYTPSEKNKSELYVATLPLLNSDRVELPPNDKLVNQFCGLERRTARGGKDSIDHSPGGHDDLCNAVAGACVLASKSFFMGHIPVTFNI